MATWGLGAYEPTTQSYMARNPTPLLLFGVHLAVTLMQLLGVLASYIFLTVNSKAFPDCTALKETERGTFWDLLATLSLRTATCEATSLGLWTFPLVICLLIPFAERHELYEDRFYFECVREKILVDFPRRGFFTAPVMLLLLLYLAVCVSVLLATVGEEHSGYRSLFYTIATALVPIGVFFAAHCLAWDLKAELLSLPQFCKEVRWAREHLEGCVSVGEREVSMASRWLLVETNLPPDPTSAHVFHRLRILAERAQQQQQQSQGPKRTASGQLIQRTPLGQLGLALAAEDGGTGGAQSRDDLEEHRAVEATARGGGSSWLQDVLWLPTDDRGRQFRCAVRSFNVLAWILEFVIVVAIVATVLKFFHMQRSSGEEHERSFMFLQRLMTAL